MPLTKKIIISLFTAIFLISSLSGCIFDEWFGVTSFSLISWSIIDDEDFAGLNITFSCLDHLTVKLLGPSSLLLDSEFFYKEDEEQYAILHLAESRHSVIPGHYKLRVYDTDDNEVFSKTFSFEGSDLSILSFYQKWWKREAWIGGYSLLEIRLIMKNNGDTPSYPYGINVTMDSTMTTGFVLPCVILPGETDYVYCFVYIENKPVDSLCTIFLEDINGNILSNDSFTVKVQDNVPIYRFEWHYKGNHKLDIPKPTYLYDYYISLDRIIIEDYSTYIFDPYDDQYIEILLDSLMFGFSSSDDVEKINYIASFVQKNIKYEVDDDTNTSYDYPRYPVETLFYGKGDCEDLSIFIASLLYKLGYRVALLRLPNHMAVGVHLDEDALPYDYYTEDYYYLETTTTPNCGYVPSSYQSPSNLTVYPITTRPLLIHNWKDGHISIFLINGQAETVKVTIVIKNLGVNLAENILVKGAFYSSYNQEINAVTKTISSLEPGMKKEFTFVCKVPLYTSTWFKTRIYYNNEVVDEHQSRSQFPESLLI